MRLSTTYKLIHNTNAKWLLASYRHCVTTSTHEERRAATNVTPPQIRACYFVFVSTKSAAQYTM